MDGYIERSISKEILAEQDFYPVTLVTGARQVGKSTLCRHLFPDYNFVNLENIDSRAVAMRDPVGFISSLGPKSIIDEVQNCPELFSQIQAVVDEDRTKRFILTGSCNFALMKSVSQSMVGRVALFTLPPLTLSEIGDKKMEAPADELIFRGFYPAVIAQGMEPYRYYRRYYNLYVERDVRDYLKVGNLAKFDTFMRLMAGRTGSEFNASSLAIEVGVSANTISQWVSMLEASYIIFPLRPYFRNISKRLTKMPKYYFTDTGLDCYLLGIEEPGQIATHPLRGQLFENLVVAQMYKNRINEVKDNNLYYYRETSGREVDILRQLPAGIHAYEIKSAQTFQPAFEKNMEYLRTVLPDVTATTVIYDGSSAAPSILNFRQL